MEHMPNWLLRRADASSAQLAVITKEHAYTFAELNRRAEETARRLLSLGLKPGERVAVLFRNGIHAVDFVHAVMRIGVILVPLNIRLSLYELKWQLEDVGAQVLVYDQPHAAQGAALRQELPKLQCMSLEEFAALPEQEGSLSEELELKQVHTIIYTSGTTGHPKGAMLTYQNHLWSALGSAANLGSMREDRWLACVPLFHVSGLSILMRSVILGMTVVLHEAFDPHQVNRSIVDNRVSIISVVSNMLSRMLDDWGEQPYPEHLRCVLLGGGPAPRPLLEKCARLGVPVVQTYGLTETGSQIVTLPPEDALRKLGSAGKPLLPCRVRIEMDGQAMPPGEVGEIVVHGPNVTPGYWGREEATAQAIVDGWLHTGDLGYLDEEGYLYVLDRRSDLIISGGENVYPAEVEAVLLSHPDVQEAGVTSRPDERWGEVPVAFVRLYESSPLSRDHQQAAEKLIAYCTERLAKYKVPAEIRVVEELPYNASGKLLRRELKRIVTQPQA